MIGIIIPTYDNLEGLKKLVESLRGFNVYVVEDGQRPETIKWLKRQKCKVVYHKENKGVAVSWNDGLKMALADGCDRFVICNDDIELPDDWTRCLEIDAHIVCLYGGDNLSPTRSAIPLTGWFFVLDKYVLDKVGFFDETLSKFTAEDTDYAIRCFIKGIRYSLTDIDVKHEGSGTLRKVKAENSLFYKEMLYNAKKNLQKKYKNLTMRA